MKNISKRIKRLQDGAMHRKILETAGIRFHKIQDLPGMSQIAGFYYVTVFGDVWSDFKGGTLRPSATNSKGYLQVCLLKACGRKRAVYVHRIVAALKFGRQLANGEEVRHLNGDKLNNRIENIDVGTSQDNANG